MGATTESSIFTAAALDGWFQRTRVVHIPRDRAAGRMRPSSPPLRRDFLRAGPYRPLENAKTLQAAKTHRPFDQPLTLSARPKTRKLPTTARPLGPPPPPLLASGDAPDRGASAPGSARRPAAVFVLQPS